LSPFRDPEPLAPVHNTHGFDCGVESLNLWLQEHAAQAGTVGSARTFVIHDNEQDRVVGYHALSAASVTHHEATARAAKGMPRHPIPAALLARLAVDTTVQGRGIGARLLRDAMLRTLNAAESVGIRVQLVHATDEDARAFYERHGFEPSPTDPLNLQMLIKDIRAAVDEVSP
jgi:GNAT superfamily N-acetyltransferase